MYLFRILWPTGYYSMVVSWPPHLASHSLTHTYQAHQHSQARKKSTIIIKKFSLLSMQGVPPRLTPYQSPPTTSRPGNSPDTPRHTPRCVANSRTSSEYTFKWTPPPPIERAPITNIVVSVIKRTPLIYIIRIVEWAPIVVYSPGYYSYYPPPAAYDATTSKAPESSPYWWQHY